MQSPKNTILAMKFFEKLESCYDKVAYGFIVNANSLVQSQKNLLLAMKFFEKLESCYEKIAYGYVVNANSLADQLITLSRSIM
ncbi:unnamed protein product, partial [Allacma fusca]